MPRTWRGRFSTRSARQFDATVCSPPAIRYWRRCRGEPTPSRSWWDCSRSRRTRDLVVAAHLDHGLRGAEGTRSPLRRRARRAAGGPCFSESATRAPGQRRGRSATPPLCFSGARSRSARSDQDRHWAHCGERQYTAERPIGGTMSPSPSERPAKVSFCEAAWVARKRLLITSTRTVMRTIDSGFSFVLPCAT